MVGHTDQRARRSGPAPAGDGNHTAVSTVLGTNGRSRVTSSSASIAPISGAESPTDPALPITASNVLRADQCLIGAQTFPVIVSVKAPVLRFSVPRKVSEPDTPASTPVPVTLVDVAWNEPLPRWTVPARSRSAWDCPLRSGEDNGSAERQGVSGGWRRGEDGVRRRHRDTRQGGRSSGRKVSLAVGTQVLAVGGEKYWCCRVCKRVMHGTSPFVRRRRQAFGPVPSRPMQGRPDPVGQHWCSAVDEHQPPA